MTPSVTYLVAELEQNAALLILHLAPFPMFQAFWKIHLAEASCSA